MKNIEKFLYHGLENLRQSLDSLSIEKFVIATIETLMHLERDAYLKKIKEDAGSDKGNGSYPRSFKSFSKHALVVNVPRTRTGCFKSMAIEFLKYNQEQVNELILKLYAKGMTTGDISSLLKDFFGNEVSPATISNLSEAFHELRQTWENSKLDAHYKVIFMDAIYITVRRGNSYSKEATHIAYGIREDNKRELLNLSINPTESTASWQEALQRIKKRGVSSVDLIVADGLKGLEDEVHQIFPEAKFQKCIVHKIRNILQKIRPKEKEQVASELKEVFNNFSELSSRKNGIDKFVSFVKRWEPKYNHLERQLDDTLTYYFTYVELPVSTRRIVYSTNSIENLNKMIRKATKNKLSFEKPSRLLDYLFVVIKEFEENNWMKYPVTAMNEWQKDTVK